MTAAPDQPSQRVDEVALHGVDLSGGASTIGRDAMTTGAASIAAAYKSGFAPPPGSPAGGSLLQAWLRYQDRQAQAAALSKDAKPTPREIERLAHAAGFKRYVRRLRKGDPNPVALAKGHARYLESGGKKSHAAWVRACAK